MVIIKNVKLMNGVKLTRKRTQVHVVPRDGEEGHEEPKDHSLRIAEVGCILGSPSLKKNYCIKWHLHTNKLFGRIGTKTALTEHSKQNQRSGVCQEIALVIHTITIFGGKREMSYIN